MRKANHLRAVAKIKPPPVIDGRYDHEWQHRQRLNAVDWAKVHVEGDKPGRIVDWVPPGWRRWWRAI